MSGRQIGGWGAVTTEKARRGSFRVTELFCKVLEHAATYFLKHVEPCIAKGRF